MSISIELYKGDITQLKIDAIVNAANNSLLGGGGVDGAIHRAAGPELLAACKKLNGCETGSAKTTPGFNLSANFVIHTVGPIWKGGVSNEAALLKSCYVSSFQEALSNNCQTLAFPAISTGVYGYPKEQAAIIAVDTIKELLGKNKSVKNTIFAIFDEENYYIYSRLLKG